MGTSKPINLVPLFHLKFLNEIRRLWCRNFKWAALAMATVSHGTHLANKTQAARPFNVWMVKEGLGRLRPGAPQN
jgi:hypothetical protein